MVRIDKFLSFVASSLLVLLLPTCKTENNGGIQQQSHPEAEAILGSAAELPCEVPPRPPSSGIKCIFWYKDDEVMSMYTVDARGGDEGKAVAGATLHVPSDRVKSRARFDPSPWPPVLHLGAVKETDAGIYYCRVDYRWDRTYMYTVVLKVIVPPRKLSILTDHDKELKGLAGPYLEGQSVTLICEAQGAKPSPTLTWWQGHEQLASVQSVTSHGFVSSAYTFIPSRSDLMTTRTCLAVNNNITAPSTVSVKIDLYLKPIDVLLSPTSVSLSAGSRAEIRCESSGSKPPARMSWFLGDDPLSNHTDLLSINGSTTTSILSFWPSRVDNGRYLKCRTENYKLSNSALENGWQLNITYVPQVKLSMEHWKKSSNQQQSNQQRSIQEGDTVRFDCEVKANPEARDVGFLFEGVPIEHESDPDITFGYRSMMIRNIKRKHRGAYQCYAANYEGTGESRVFYLKALYTPVCKEHQLITYTVPNNTREQISCQVDADPLPFKFEWSFSNVLDKTPKNVSWEFHRLLSVAYYTPTKASDYGNLYCWATNSVGEQQKACFFTIIPLEPPESLKNCSYSNITTTSISIECMVRYPKKGTDYYLDVDKHQSKELVHLMRSTSPSFEIEGLAPGTEFEFHVYANNSEGRSEDTILKVSTLPLPMEERVIRKSSHNRNTSRGIGVALILGAAICCILIFTSVAIWTKIKGGPGCQKCKELPKKFSSASFSNQGKTTNLIYIDRMPDGYEKRIPCI